MTVTFSLEVQVPNAGVQTSEYIKNLMLDLNVEDVVVTIPSKYAPVLDIYVNFVNGTYIPVADISGRPDVNIIVPLCFDMESYFADNEFLRYLMFLVYPIWKDFYPTISKVPDERLVYLYTPYEFVPSEYMNNPSFFKTWLEINQNSKITLNGNEVYHTDVEYSHDYDDYGRLRIGVSNTIEGIHVYHTINQVKIGDDIYEERYDDGQIKFLERLDVNGQPNGSQKMWYENGQIANTSSFINGKQVGLVESWHENGQLKYSANYVDGKIQGLVESWNTNGQLANRTNYINGDEQGLVESWYENGQLATRTNYINGMRKGLQERWYENGQLVERGNFDEIEQGLQERWYENGQIEERENYNDSGALHGLRESWYENGQIEERRNYSHWKMDGLQEAWYENGQLKYRENYVDGELIGEPQYWYENGQVKLNNNDINEQLDNPDGD